MARLPWARPAHSKQKDDKDTLITDHQTFLKIQATGHRLSGEERLGLSLPDTNSSLANILSKSSWLGP